VSQTQRKLRVSNEIHDARPAVRKIKTFLELREYCPDRNQHLRHTLHAKQTLRGHESCNNFTPHPSHSKGQQLNCRLERSLPGADRPKRTPVRTLSWAEGHRLLQSGSGIRTRGGFARGCGIVKKGHRGLEREQPAQKQLCELSEHGLEELQGHHSKGGQAEEVEYWPWLQAEDDGWVREDYFFQKHEGG